MADSLVFPYAILGILIFGLEIRRIRLGLPLDAMTLFNGAYFILFVFVPINVLIIGEDAVRQKHAYHTWSHGNFLTALTLIASYLTFVFGYYRPGAATSSCKALISLKLALRVTFVFFVLGISAISYHVGLIGGAIDALILSPGLRTGQVAINGNYLFIRNFSYFAATAFMLLFALYIDLKSGDFSHLNSRLRLGKYFYLLVLFGLVFIYYALSTYGRREFLYAAIICAIVWSTGVKRRIWEALGLLIAISAVWFYVYSFVIPPAFHAAISPAAASPATTPLELSTFLKDTYLRSVQGLGDSFMHFVAAQHAELWQFGFLTDLKEMPLQFLPSQVLGFERPRGMFGQTSEFILGHPLEPGLSGEEPLGLHGYLLVNFSYIGMFIIFFVAGYLYRKIDFVLRPSKSGPALYWLIFLWATVGSLEFLREGMLSLVIKPRLSWWLAIGILLWHGFRRSAHSSIAKQNPERK